MGKYQSTMVLEKDRQLFEVAKTTREKYVKLWTTELLPLSRAMKTKEAMEVYKAKVDPAFQEFYAAAGNLVIFNKENGETSGTRITKDVSSATTGIVIGLIAALALGASIGIFLSRSISTALNVVIQSLSSGSEQVSSASSQVSQSSQQMAEGASEQASSLEETSASLEEMSSMTRQNSDNARQANTMATETRGAVEKSREAMTRMGDAITRIKGSSDQTAKIIKTIDEIAFQTNLLALNAAVEAARAGDAGKGFAVVAEEVRNLAQRSAEAAKSTAALIEESQQNANNGVAVSNEVAGILSGIVESVHKLTQLIGEVSAASDEQSKGIEQIGTAVTQMDKLTQANAANAEESASASEELAAQAKELGDMVRVLVGIVKGAGSQDAFAPASAGPRPLPRAARPVAAAKPAAPRERAKPAAPATKPQGRDWSPAGHAPVTAQKGHGNGHAKSAALAGARPVNPEQVIPMDDSDLKDF
jgi:methyl-accepting chemotaxis protein